MEENKYSTASASSEVIYKVQTLNDINLWLNRLQPGTEEVSQRRSSIRDLKPRHSRPKEKNLKRH